MKLLSGVAFASSLVVTILSAGAASADCKSTCNTSYAACGQAGKDQLQCLEGWRTCKTRCSGGVVAPVATTSAAPKGGVIQKAAVKVVEPAKKH